MSISIISLEARWKARLPDGRRVFAKASGSDVRSWRRDAVKRIGRDRVCLEALAGLAVPRAVALPPSCLLPGVCENQVVAQEWVRGAALDHAGLSRPELLGAWAFVAEQLTAFRRREVLYSDVKCANVLACRKPLSVTVIDFDFATVVSGDGRYRSRDLGYTPGFEAPEHPRRRWLRERAVVYQLGMLLLHCWTGTRNEELRAGGAPLRALERELGQLGARGAAAVARACLDEVPERRPSGYEDVLRRLGKDGGLPPPAKAVWRRLRAPYARALSELGLEA